MANEPVLRNRRSAPVDFNIDDPPAIEKGSFLQLVDGRKASGVLVQGAACAGIARREKIAADGRTQLSVFYDGDFDVLASGAVGIGLPLQLAGDTQDVEHAGVNASGAQVIGHALEAAGDKETFQMRLTLG